MWEGAANHMPFFTHQNIAVAIHSTTLGELQALRDLDGGGYLRGRRVGRHVEVRREHRPHGDPKILLTSRSFKFVDSQSHGNKSTNYDRQRFVNRQQIFAGGFASLAEGRRYEKEAVVVL